MCMYGYIYTSSIFRHVGKINDFILLSGAGPIQFKGIQLNTYYFLSKILYI
jgi:hypothetical protein